MHSQCDDLLSICWMKFWTTSLIRCHPSCARLGSSNVCTTNNYSLPPHFGEVLANQSISYGNCKSTIIVKWWLNSHPWCMYIVYYGNSTDWINGSRSPGCQILKLRASGNHELLCRVERAPPVKIKWSVRCRRDARQAATNSHINGLHKKNIHNDVIFSHRLWFTFSNL